MKRRSSRVRGPRDGGQRGAPAPEVGAIAVRTHAVRSRGRVSIAEQLEFDFGGHGGRWRFSRLVARSPHFARILERLEFVRRHFPELETACIRVGLARKRGVLGWGSLDPHHPAIWVRPRRLDYFTIAHELTHLLQARGQVPRGERACDLHALARSPLLVDAPPSYLKLPAALRRGRTWDMRAALPLHRAARRALEARAGGERSYLRQFERAVEAACRLRLVRQPEESG